MTLLGLTTWFANPAALVGLTILAALAVLGMGHRKRNVNILQPWPRLQSLAGVHSSRQTMVFALRGIALLMLVLAAAGPRLGQASHDETRLGRDLVIVLDLSRSMLAEQPSRREKALRSLQSLVESSKNSNANRLAMVIFAAKPHTLFPLTRDLNHLRVTLAQLAGNGRPLNIQSLEDDGVISGTRIGAALTQALDLLTPARPNRQEIVLLSDGDDPAAADDEWQTGITAARQRGVPVHVVAVGEPGVQATIPYRDDVLKHDGKVVHTQVATARLQEIARRTGGQFYDVPAGAFPLESRLQDHWRKNPSSDDLEEGKSAGLRRPLRWPWLLASLLVWLGSSAPIGLRSQHRTKLSAMTAALALAFLVAANPGSADQAWVARGNDAFARQDFTEALRCYDQALLASVDPGLIAFNQAAAHFRLGQYREAELHYQQALDDAAIPPSRRARAWFDLGNTILHQSGTDDRRRLERAIDAYRSCLAEDPDTDLRDDALQNLDLAGIRWLKTQPSPQPEGNEPSPTKSPKSKDPKSKPPDNSGEKKSSSNDSSNNNDPNGKSGDPEPGISKKTAARGALSVLPDTNQPVVLTPRETTDHLDVLIDRILRERRNAHRQADLLSPQGKDW